VYERSGRAVSQRARVSLRAEERMERRAWLAAAVAALAGAGLLRFYMHRLEQEVRGGPSVRAIVLTRDAASGDALTREMLGTRELPQAYLESRHIRARDLDQVVGAALAVPGRASEMLLWTDLGSVRERTQAVSSLVPDGMRAVSLARGASGMDELLAPGDRVDVLLVPDRSGPVPFARAERIAENLLVLSAGGEPCEMASRRARSGVVTVSATPDQSLQLAAAERAGALRLVLRNPGDIAITLAPQSERLSPAAREPPSAAASAENAAGQP
jgi:pilus assembly protein CpaB